MDKKFILSVLLIFVVSLILGYIAHGWALADEYQATGLFRSVAAQEGYLPWMLLGYVVFAFAFVSIYRQGIEDKAWVAQGLRFGVLIGLLAAVAICLIYYAVMPLPEMLVFRQAVYDFINMIILGLVVAWMYR